MSIQARKKATNKKSGATAADRRILKRAAREDAEGKAAKALAEILRDGRAEHEAERARFEAKEAQRQAFAETKVPVTLSQICSLVAHDVKPERFAATALTELAAQLEILAEAAENTEFHGYEAWKFVQNLIERTRFAGRVSAWLSDGATSEVLPEVVP